jgi:hypothetical protein
VSIHLRLLGEPHLLPVDLKREGTAHAYDKLTLIVNGTTVQSFSNVNKGSTYVQRSVNVSSYAGQTITLKWTGTEDYSLATSFFVDDTTRNLGAAALLLCRYSELCAPVAQGIERRTPKPGVAGSNPAGGTAPVGHCGARCFRGTCLTPLDVTELGGLRAALAPDTPHEPQFRIT